MLSLPNIEPDDADMVVLALETAQTLWENADHRESLRWLRKAAEAASDAGADTRAVSLAKSAAEIATAIDLSPTHPPNAETAEHAAETLPWERPEEIATSGPTRPLARREAIRVGVLQGTSATELVLVALDEGEPLPDGASEAVLVMMHAGVSLET
jgi:hypothetical protein